MTTIPINIATISQASGTLAASGTFQALFSANPARIGGLIQNNGAAVMYIYPGTTAAAQAAGTAAGLQIAASGGTRDLTFGAPDAVYNGQVVIAGTSGQVFVAIENTGETV